MNVEIDPKKIIVALDFPDEKTCLRNLESLDPELCRVKVGKELFTRCGPQLVKQIVASGYDVFLDLKFHDIPTTVAKAVAAAAELGVWMVNVHASGGRAMMSAAREELNDKDSPLLIAVTVLTSMAKSDLEEVGIQAQPEHQVKLLAALSADCGLDGVVCSAQETSVLRAKHASDFLLVTPGIRPAGDEVGDQRRVETPASALSKGSDYLVIGRPITQSADPSLKLRSIIKEIEES